jgi:hypothetical protein
MGEIVIEDGRCAGHVGERYIGVRPKEIDGICAPVLKP